MRVLVGSTKMGAAPLGCQAKGAELSGYAGYAADAPSFAYASHEIELPRTQGLEDARSDTTMNAYLVSK